MRYSTFASVSSYDLFESEILSTYVLQHSFMQELLLYKNGNFCCISTLNFAMVSTQFFHLLPACKHQRSDIFIICRLPKDHNYQSNKQAIELRPLIAYLLDEAEVKV